MKIDNIGSSKNSIHLTGSNPTDNAISKIDNSISTGISNECDSGTSLVDRKAIVGPFDDRIDLHQEQITQERTEGLKNILAIGIESDFGYRLSDKEIIEALLFLDTLPRELPSIYQKKVDKIALKYLDLSTRGSMYFDSKKSGEVFLRSFYNRISPAVKLLITKTFKILDGKLDINDYYLFLEHMCQQYNEGIYDGNKHQAKTIINNKIFDCTNYLAQKWSQHNWNKKSDPIL